MKNEIRKATCKCGYVEWEMRMKLFKDTQRNSTLESSVYKKHEYGHLGN